MSWAGPEFVILIVAISTFGWVANNWIRARHGYAVEDEWGGKTHRADTQEAAALRKTNELLTARLEQLEDRTVILERIITDKGFDVATQIEALRDPPRIAAAGAEREISR